MALLVLMHNLSPPPSLPPSLSFSPPPPSLCCSVSLSHTCRLSLLSEWCGLRDEQLSQISEIPGCVFVHANGFIGGNLNYEGALAMAKKTLQMRTNN
jgi:hypothetical protein